MKIVAICSGKGGVGKTTTTIYLGQSLAYLGFRVLLIDFDFNSNLSKFFFKLFKDVVNESEGKNSYKALVDGCDFEPHIYKTGTKIDFISTIERLKKIDFEFYDDPGFKSLFGRELRKLDYDFVLIDLHNVVNVVLDAAVFNADQIVSPMEYGDWSQDGTAKILKLHRENEILQKRKIPLRVVPSRVTKKKAEKIISLGAQVGLTVSGCVNINDDVVLTSSNLGELLKPDVHAAFARFLELAKEVSI
ncbi:ParA family protein [Leptospira adleri]|uniref:AAA domain-containing protein n=1 Tax=Leptospira adleri TaxID=2023186 RepID=A0A2M9YJB0_9LEPT|nr:ParA family protein [Leptospira adleri]PJZ51623.1 hypothetical protein CH380_19450 [Leptospira adleri]PJZ61868.1 hypothetical protein CH376_10715 [Leptospira adleri]